MIWIEKLTLIYTLYFLRVKASKHKSLYFKSIKENITLNSTATKSIIPHTLTLSNFYKIMVAHPNLYQPTAKPNIYNHLWFCFGLSRWQHTIHCECTLSRCGWVEIVVFCFWKLMMWPCDCGRDNDVHVQKLIDKSLNQL